MAIIENNGPEHFQNYVHNINPIFNSFYFLKIFFLSISNSFQFGIMTLFSFENNGPHIRQTSLKCCGMPHRDYRSHVRRIYVFFTHADHQQCS